MAANHSDDDVPAERDDWDSHWRRFEAAAGANPAQRFRRRLVLRRLAADGGPGRFLDVGSGTGDLALAAREVFPGADILGLELSRSGVETARRKVPQATFVQTDLLSESPEARWRGWATHAVCSEVLEHVEAPQRLLENVFPYLAPGALLVVTVPGGPMTAFDRHIGHRRHFRPDDVRTLLEAAGFEVERATGAGFPVFDLYRLAVRVRGRRVAADAVSGATPSRLARAAMRVFDAALRAQPGSVPLGWQIVAAARRPAPA